MIRRDLIVKCPECGAQYLPAEIFYPKHFFGNPKDIYKDEKNEILGINGTEMDTTESYVCDKCGKEFVVEAIINFKVSRPNHLFDEDDFETPDTK